MLRTYGRPALIGGSTSGVYASNLLGRSEQSNFLRGCRQDAAQASRGGSDHRSRVRQRQVAPQARPLPPFPVFAPGSQPTEQATAPRPHRRLSTGRRGPLFEGDSPRIAIRVLAADGRGCSCNARNIGDQVCLQIRSAAEPESSALGTRRVNCQFFHFDNRASHGHFFSADRRNRMTAAPPSRSARAYPVGVPPTCR